jgi:hypothetical protein
LTHTQHALLVLAVIACRWLATRCCPTYDDAFITYRYAQHMAEGLGLVYNPGAPWEPVLGTTTPLYALLLAGCARLGADLVTASLALNFACDGLTAALLPRVFDRARVPSTVALVAFAALPHLVRISVGGMEAPLFALCGLGAVLTFARGRFVLAGVLAASACLVRPEGVLLCAILFFASVRRPRQLLRFAVPVAVIGAASALWLIDVYGSAIPQSVRAKASIYPGDAARELLGRWRTIAVQAFAPSRVMLPFLPLVLFGMWRSVARGGGRLFSLWALAITASYLIARPHAWGWYFYVALVAWTLWLGLGVERVWDWIEPKLPRALAGMAPSKLPAALALTVCAGAFAVAWSRPSAVDALVYRPMRDWATRTSSTEPAARLLASDIGAIGWWWKGTVLDSEGLVWPEAKRFGSPSAIIAAKLPEYVMSVAERAWLEDFQGSGELFARYEPVARFSASGKTALHPALDELSPQWSQDYIVYRLRGP